jgi:tRNA/tmRNA/rRNA uracil-C5-methylase (TrmA/RlmC/RlmD family)
VQFRGGLISTVLPRLVKAGAQFDTVLFNPMRETLGETTMRAAAETGAARVVYIAPAPRAAAEDIGTLRRLGYEVHEVGAADMHPGTANVLMVVVMMRAGEGAGFSPARGDSASGTGAQVSGE